MYNIYNIKYIKYIYIWNINVLICQVMLDGIVSRLQLLLRLPHHGVVERSVGLIYNVTMKLNGCQYEPNLGIRIQYEVKISPETKVLLIRFFQTNNTVHVYNQYIFLCVYIYIYVYMCVYIILKPHRFASSCRTSYAHLRLPRAFARVFFLTVLFPSNSCAGTMYP